MSEDNKLAVSKWWQPETLDEGLRMADIMAKSDLVPKDYKGKPGNIVVAMQMGAEIGLAPMQALQNIAVVNGNPTVWGDALLALVLSHPECDGVEEESFVDPKEGIAARCTVLRKGRKPVTETFSKEDAEVAGIWGRNVWKTYPKRMLKYRARAFALRDAFADVLKGVRFTEEVQDYEQIQDADVTVVDEGDTRSEQLANRLADNSAVVRDERMAAGEPDPIEPAPAPTKPMDNIMAAANEKADAMERINNLLVTVSAATSTPVTKLEAGITETFGKPFLEMTMEQFLHIEKKLTEKLEASRSAEATTT